ncbi:EAL domain-containing protein [Halomonas organivorans]|uniref:EAL domain-containing protein (Putative c-di-GMP-specific phosphodiesterase class I)/GGDEF domain-containing protein n=1 Tax=Halomonas organivorans TaxID=257772 RepID=A0A7W5G5E7_9GAMM|nr:EAL domain-containing protein [Halomonas organivorans]MBB3140346.1 EAL domain-containing protein (putative c-di-GMP-specific phosphodiesterase class I)/GGDEF domain-containing protein [Halomonas organivorans]
MTGSGREPPGNQDERPPASAVRYLPAVLSRLAVEHAPVGLVLVDGQGLIRWASAGFRRLLDRHDEALEGHSIEEWFDCPGFLAFQRDVLASLEGGWQQVRLASQGAASQGADREPGRLVLVSVSAVEPETGDALRLLSVIDPLEAPEVAAAPETAPYLASVWRFEDRLRHALERADRLQGQVGLLMLRLARPAAPDAADDDELGGRVGRRLAHTLRREDSLAKLAPGCWGVLIEPPLSPEGLQTAALRCLEAMEAPVLVDERALLPSLSIGIAIHPEDGETPEQLLASAESALRRAGPSRYAFFDDGLRRRLAASLNFRQQLQAALLEPEAHFQLLFQPQLELRSGRCVGLEALVRWRHPRDGLLTPEHFLPTVAELGQQVRLDRWVITEAIAQRTAWRAAGSRLAELGVAVNAHVDLLDQAVFDRRPLDVFLRQQGLEPGWLCLELAQQGLIDRAGPQAHLLRRLQRLGVGLAVNDIGTGPLDLLNLTSLPVSRVKLSPVLLDSFDALEAGNALEALLRCLEVLCLESVLVGVETAPQLEAARRLGVTLAQGRLLGAPQSAEALEAWWAARAVSG